MPELLEALGSANIEARPVWKPLHMQPLYIGSRFYAHDESAIVCEQLFRSGICLPSGSNLTAEDQQRVIARLEERLDHAAYSSMKQTGG
ncbi:putative pyridoxal phosphate-dependent aminotransferase EpsN [compost metagenome]